MNGHRTVPASVACAAALLTAGVVGAVGAVGASAGALERAPAKTTLGPYRPDESAQPPAALDAFGYVQRLFATLDQPGASLEAISAEVAPGSDAALHQQYLASVAAARQSNEQPTTHTVSLDGEDIRVCETAALETAAAAPSVPSSSLPAVAGDACDVYSGFVADATGRLVEYSTDGVALEGRFGEVTPLSVGPMEVRGGFAFDDDGTVVVVVDAFAALQTVHPHWDQAEMSAAGGDPVPVDRGRSAGPDELSAGSAGAALLTFPGAGLGGTLAVPVAGDLALSSSLVQVEIVAI